MPLKAVLPPLAAMMPTLATAVGSGMSQNVVIAVEGLTLAGIWQAAIGRQVGPPVVILPGSGPTDRDGNNPLGVAGGPYARLAQALAQAGTPSLRADKRGLFGSAAAGIDPNAVTLALYGADAQALAIWAAARAGTDCAWLLGHSEGGLVALAVPDAPQICGRILVATPGRPLGKTMRALFAADPALAEQLDVLEPSLARLEAGQRLDPAIDDPAALAVFPAAVQGFLIDLLAFDPAVAAAATSLPMLIVQGDSDLQVTPADARALAAARPDATLAILPGVNHVLRTAPPDRPGNLATYADVMLPLDPQVVAAIVTVVAR